MTAPAVPAGDRPSRRRPGSHVDAGFTAIEMVVAMSLMSTLLVVFTTGLVGFFRSANRNQAAVTAQSQIHLAFQRLDTQIRYASAISREGVAPGTSDWYVEYLSNYTGVPACTQLRLTSSGRLQQRTWTQGDTTLPAFATLASGVSGTQPFTRIPAGTDGYSLDRLVVSVTATGGRDAHARQIDSSFAALNSSVDTSDAAACDEGRPS